MASTDLILRAKRLLSPPHSLAGDAVLIREGRIAAHGWMAELCREFSGAEQVDLGGATLLPGFQDSHTHFFEWARRMAGLDLSGLGGPEELPGALEQHCRRVREEGVWVGGGGWDPAFLERRPRLDRALLDTYFPEHPVALESRDFHTIWCNTRALELTGVLEGKPSPPGGEIGRRADGSPDGLLYETAWQLILDARPPEPAVQRARWLRQAIRRAHSMGLTGFHSMEPEDAYHSYRELADRRELEMRVVFHSPLVKLAERLDRDLPSYAAGDDWLRWGGVKIFMDGSLGSRSAYMLEPYPDGTHGRLLMPQEELVAHVLEAARAGIAPTIHAIGDACVRLVVDALEESTTKLRSQALSLPRGARIEHAQCVRPEEIPRLAGLGVLCAMQPTHLGDDVPLLPRLWPEASAFAYPLRSLLNGGVRIALGSDVPVATPDPRRGIYAALERRAQNSPTGKAWHPEESLHPLEALAGYTRWAAEAGRWQDELGVLEVGHRADLVAIEIPEEGAPASDWLEAQLRMTMVDGRIVYEALP